MALKQIASAATIDLAGARTAEITGTEPVDTIRGAPDGHVVTIYPTEALPVATAGNVVPLTATATPGRPIQFLCRNGVLVEIGRETSAQGYATVVLTNGTNSAVALPPHASHVVFTGLTADATVTGFSMWRNGRVVMIENGTAYTVSLPAESLTETVAVNRLGYSRSKTLVLRAGEKATVLYNGADTRWSLQLDHRLAEGPFLRPKIIEKIAILANGTAANTLTDLYTVPAGRMAILASITCVSTANLAHYANIRVGGVDYRASSNVAINGTVRMRGLVIPAKAGDVIGIVNVPLLTSAITVMPRIYEFDDDSPVVAVQRVVTSGQQTLYTSTFGIARGLANNEFAPSDFETLPTGTGAGTPASGATPLFPAVPHGPAPSSYFISNGGPTNLVLDTHVIPSGGSIGTSNKIASAVSVSTGVVGARGVNLGVANLSTVEVNVTTFPASGNMMIFATFVEHPTPV